jgi:hypothetical protein
MRSGRRSKSKRLPLTIHDLVMAGGPEGLAREAAEAAARTERKFWLDVLVGMKLDDDADPWDHAMRSDYIRALRRKLGIKLPKNVIRGQTRERVRRHRERRRATA